MRIGIVTQPLEMNYGGILQNWALQQALRRLGHDPIAIDAYERYSTPHYLYNWMRTALSRILGKKANWPKRYCGSLRNELMGQFVEQHIAKTRVMWDYKRSVVNRYHLDALVVGSDQVWRARYNGGHLEDMYLRFAEGLPLKRVAYAASFGIDEWEYSPEQTASCSALAQQMDAISVREASGVDLCREHLGVDATCVLDPTMLLDAVGYQDIIDDQWDAGEPYLAVYCLDITPAKEEFFNRLAQERGLTVRYYSAGWKSTLTVGQWLAMFSHASLVVTDSFHGTVFSILFGREFYTMCNPGRGNTRIVGLLRDLALEDRLVSDSEPVEPADSTVNWEDVYARLEKRRQESQAFLEKAFNN